MKLRRLHKSSNLSGLFFFLRDPRWPSPPNWSADGAAAQGSRDILHQTGLLLNKQCSTSRPSPVPQCVLIFCSARSLLRVLVDRHRMHKTSGGVVGGGVGV